MSAWVTFKKSFKKQVIRGDDASVYLIRWAINTPLFGIKLHHILRSDDERDLHDHPWSFLSIILWGGYFEHTPDWEYPFVIAGKCPTPRATVRRWHGPLSILWRPTPSTHRLEIPSGRTAWSLVFTGPKKREWGFHTICGWIEWTSYWQKKQEGC